MEPGVGVAVNRVAWLLSRRRQSTLVGGRRTRGGSTLTSVFARLNASLPAGRRPPLVAGVVAAVALVVACTGIVYPLKQVTSVSSLGVVYLFGVVVVSAFWGVWLGM